MLHRVVQRILYKKKKQLNACNMEEKDSRHLAVNKKTYFLCVKRFSSAFLMWNPSMKR